MEEGLLRRLESFCARTGSEAFTSGDYPLVYDGGAAGEALTEHHLLVDNASGKPNRIFLKPGRRRKQAELRIRFMAEGCDVYIDGDTQVRGVIRLHADGCRTVIRGGQNEPSPFNITQWSKRTVVYIGCGTTSNGTNLVAMGEDAAILIGDDCMFSSGVWVKTSDMHCIADLTSDTMVNRNGNRGDVELGRHVWLGQDVLVTHAVRIGSGAIVGAKSMVREDVPERTLWAGTPARRLREEVTWLRAHVLDKGELGRIRKALAIDPSSS